MRKNCAPVKLQLTRYGSTNQIKNSTYNNLIITFPHLWQSETKLFECRTSTQYAQILCRIEKKLAKHIGPEEFLQCSSNILLDKQVNNQLITIQIYFHAKQNLTLGININKLNCFTNTLSHIYLIREPEFFFFYYR